MHPERVPLDNVPPLCARGALVHGATPGVDAPCGNPDAGDELELARDLRLPGSELGRRHRGEGRGTLVDGELNLLGCEDDLFSGGVRFR